MTVDRLLGPVYTSVALNHFNDTTIDCCVEWYLFPLAAPGRK